MKDRTVEDLLISKYVIHLDRTRKEFVRRLTSDEESHLLNLKKGMLEAGERCVQYYKDTIKVLEQENTDIIRMGLLIEEKYKNIYEENLRRIPLLKSDIINGERETIIQQQEIYEIENALNQNIPINSNEYGGFSIPEKRWDE